MPQKQLNVHRSKSAADRNGLLPSETNGALEHALGCVLRQLPSDARNTIVGALVEGGDAGSGKQPTLAAARRSCKALRGVIDDGLHSLRLSVLPDTDQGPAPCLSRFPNVTSLTLSIDAVWRAPTPNSSWSELLPDEQPMPQAHFRNATAHLRANVYPPSRLLKPLQGQPLESLQRLRNLALIGRLTSFGSLCKQLSAAFGATVCDASAAGPSTSTGAGHASALPSAEPASSGGLAVGTSAAGAAGGSGSSAGGGVSGGGPGSGRGCSLVHLDLGNARFPANSVNDNVIARGHAALGPLGLQELTMGVKLLPGMEVHKELRRLHVHHARRWSAGPDPEELIACLRPSSVQHVGLLGNGWVERSIEAVMAALPDTVTSVLVDGACGAAALRLGRDEKGQDTRELVLEDRRNFSSAGHTVRALRAWPHALPPGARVNLVHLKRLHVQCEHGIEGLNDQLLPVLAHAERVECGMVTVGRRTAAQVLPRLQVHTLPREVRLEVRLVGYPLRGEELRLAVVTPAGRGRGGGEAGLGAGQGTEAAAAATAAAQLPAVGDVLERAVEEMVARAQLGRSWREQEKEGKQAGRTTGRYWAQGSDDTDRSEEDEEDVVGAEWWWRKGMASRKWRGFSGVLLLLAGPGVSALAAHSTAEGAAALEGALGGLSCSHRGDRKERTYMVLPGGRGVLLHWDGEELAEATTDKAVRRAAAALGREVPEGGVRVVALPHTCLDSASSGLEDCAQQVLSATVRLSGDRDLAGQLQAVAELWGQLEAQRDNPRCARRPVPSTGPRKAVKTQPPRPRASTTVMTRASRAAAAAGEAKASAAAALPAKAKAEAEAEAAATGEGSGSAAGHSTGEGSGSGGNEGDCSGSGGEPELTAGRGREAEGALQRARKRRRPAAEDQEGAEEAGTKEGTVEGAEEGAEDGAGPSSPLVGGRKQLVGRRTRRRRS